MLSRLTSVKLWYSVFCKYAEHFAYHARQSGNDETSTQLPSTVDKSNLTLTILKQLWKLTFKTFCEFEKNQRLFWLKHLFFFYVKLSLLAVVIYINRTRTLLYIIAPSSSYSKAVILPCDMR